MKIFLVGGFLGSGKTTAIHNACLQLKDAQVTVGVITNDQGSDLVDSRYIEGTGVRVMEVTDGCFCCNYDKFDELLGTFRNAHHTDVVFAESVGSCTDLVATVVKPLARYSDEVEVVVSVFADATILPTMLQGSRLFVSSVHYIYLKQLEEADVIVVSKIDLLPREELIILEEMIRARFPNKTILLHNSIDDQDIRKWIDVLNLVEPENRLNMEMDYALYGAGEAALGWLDADLKFISDSGEAFDLAADFIESIHNKVSGENFQIGHLKYAVADEHSMYKVSFTSGAEAQTPLQFIGKKAREVSVLVNARIQADPEHFKTVIKDLICTLNQIDDVKIIIKKMVAFKPGFPSPTHRILDPTTC